MPAIDQVLDNTVRRCRERNIIIPTYREMRNPELIPEGIRAELADIGLWDLNPRNLFRITWKNEPVASGGGFGGVNFLELPPSLDPIAGPTCMLAACGVRLTSTWLRVPETTDTTRLFSR